MLDLTHLNLSITVYYPNLEMLLKADIWHHIILPHVQQRDVGKQNISLDLNIIKIT